MATQTPEQRLAADRAITQLKEIDALYGKDREKAHSRADGALCGLLIQLGYQDVVDQFEKMVKWYA